MHAKYAKINGHLASVKTILKRGDSVEIGVDENIMPQEDWRTSAKTYEALRSINIYLDHLPKPKYCRCNSCHPIPGEEVIGFKENDGTITVHRRDCTLAISLVSQFGDNIVAADDFKENSETLYPASLTLKAVDRKHLLSDIIETISNQLHLSILSLNTNTVDEIVTTTINFTIHSYQELRTIVQNIQNIPDVDEVIYNNK
jgi:GTP pyrophosphokinase